MQAILQLDDELVERLRVITEEDDVQVLVDRALAVFAERVAIEGLIALGGSAPDMEDIPRRRSEPA